MSLIYFAYFNLFSFFLICLVFFSGLLKLCSFLGPILISNNKGVLKNFYGLNRNKKSAYECGFEPFNDTRGSFEVHFHITAIMFLLFDVEVAFLLPWLVCLKEIGASGFWCGFIFFIVLLIGFIYELKRGALDWPKDFN